WINTSFHVRDVVIFETTKHMCDRIDLTNVRKELIAQAFTLRSTANQAGDVDEGDACRNDLCGFRDDSKLLEALVGNGHIADIGLDCAERIIRSLRRGRRRQRVEKRRLADIGKTDDTALKSHYLSSGFGFFVGGLSVIATLFMKPASSSRAR